MATGPHEPERSPAELTARVAELEAELSSLRQSYDLTLGAMVTALDYRERESGHHSHRVALYAVFLGRRAGVEGSALEALYRGSLLHDIGHVGTPESVLVKEGPLSTEDWDLLRQHAELGAAIVTGIARLREACDVPRAHHEAWNGRGYPHGLREHEIPLSARIFAVVDSYDAVRCPRPFKGATNHEHALAQLERAAGVRLDPGLFELFREEPASTWTELDKFVGRSFSFEAALQACVHVAAR
jgi:HD-GYP domain-containing protein (c-di-GMP phosphodiesterase class II)